MEETVVCLIYQKRVMFGMMLCSVIHMEEQAILELIFERHLAEGLCDSCLVCIFGDIEDVAWIHDKK